MSLLCLWLLFFAGFGLSSGEASTNATSITVYGVLGGSALLQIHESKWEQSPETCTLEWKKEDSRVRVQKNNEQANDTSCQKIMNCTILINGNLLLSNIATTDAGNYTAEIFSSDGKLKDKWHFLLEIQDAVPEPMVNYTCLSNGSVQLSCQVENGTGPSYFWSWNGTLQKISNSSGQITVHQTVLINVTCTATNQISVQESEPRNVTCQPDTSTTVPTGVLTSAAIPDTNSTENSTLHGCHHGCLLRSVAVGTVIVIVTTLPLIIGCLYTMPREKHQRPQGHFKM